jgi:hypothetical protein
VQIRDGVARWGDFYHGSMLSSNIRTKILLKNQPDGAYIEGFSLHWL